MLFSTGIYYGTFGFCVHVLPFLPSFEYLVKFKFYNIFSHFFKYTSFSAQLLSSLMAL